MTATASRCLATVRARVDNTEVALDVTAEVFAKALEHCESFSSRGEGSAKGTRSRATR